jgi:hypothetical protein
MESYDNELVEALRSPSDWGHYIYQRRRHEIEMVRKETNLLSLEQRKIVNSVIFQIGTLKNELFLIFSKYSEICENCPFKCCDTFELSLGDYIYYAINNFELPMPTSEWIETLLKRDIVGCFFLSKNGCILGSNKPSRCLLAMCDRLRQKLPSDIVSNINSLVQKIRDEKKRLTKLEFLKKLETIKR